MGQLKVVDRKVEVGGLFEPYQNLTIDTEEWSAEFLENIVLYSVPSNKSNGTEGYFDAVALLIKR
jgi:hypothetical protein